MSTRINNSRLFKKILLTLLTIVLFGLFLPSVQAQESTVTDITNPKLGVHLFYSDSCPHCAKEKEFLEKMQYKYPGISVKLYEVSKNRDNLKLFVEVGTKLGDKSGRVPFLVIGENYILGYLSDETHGVQIEQLIIKGLETPPDDLVQKIKDNTTQNSENKKPKPEIKEKFEMTLPLLGKVNVYALTLPVMTIILGLVDGFNPCAMWALLFLISILIETKNKTKMWLLGGTFILVSGLVYFLFMAAWLNFFLIIGYAVAVRIAIGVIATGLGGYYLWRYWTDLKNGCFVEGDEKRQETFKKLRKLTEKDHILWAMAGMALLAIAVNMVELLCSAGIPAIYTKALTMSQLATWQYYLYLAAYVFFFMLDDLVVFIIAMVTLETVGIKQKYAKYSQFIGGIIMLLIGILMLIKPEVLMFK